MVDKKTEPADTHPSFLPRSLASWQIWWAEAVLERTSWWLQKSCMKSRETRPGRPVESPTQTLPRAGIDKSSTVAVRSVHTDQLIVVYWISSDMLAWRWFYFGWMIIMRIWRITFSRCLEYSCHSVRMSCWIKRLVTYLLTYWLTFKLLGRLPMISPVEMHR